MKPMKAAIIIVCLLFSLQSQSQQKYCKVKINVPGDDAKKTALLAAFGIDHFNTASDGGILAEISATDVAKIKSYGYKCQVLIPDIMAYLDSVNNKYYRSLTNIKSRVAIEQPGSTVDAIIKTPAAFQVKSTFGGYYSFAEMNTAMDNLVASYPSIAKKISLGKTAENRDIWLIKISDNVATDETNEPEVLYMGLQHAREAITGASMIFLMQYLCENYATDNRIKNLIDNRELYIIPCFNPDGWEYNRTSQNGSPGGMWRKNRNPIPIYRQNGNISGYNYGIDLNRNWGVDWGNCNAPILGNATSCGSDVPTDETYWGANAFSELETQAVRAFTQSHHIVAGFDQHAFGPYYSLPFGRHSLHSMSVKGQNFYTAIPALMGTYNGMRAADSYDALGYEVAGGFKDWMLMGDVGTGTKDTVYAMTGEGAAGGGTSGNNFWAPASEIIDLSKGMCYQNLQLAFAAGTYVDIQDANDIAINNKTGNLSYTIKRLGLGNEPVTITLVPLENIQSVGSPSVQSSMDYYETITAGISYNLNPAISNGQRIKYAWLVSAGGYNYSDTITRFYNPTQLFSDDMEGTLSNNWTATSNVTDNWAFTTLAAYGGSKSLTESPAGNYTSSTTRTITNKNTFDLSGATEAYLTFWTKYRAENHRDKLQVQVSANGTSWTAIPGSTTIQEPGTLDGATLNGIPSLTGIRDYWTQEIFDLRNFIGNNTVSFRMVFTSDGDPTSFKFEKDDGFYIDNMKMIKSNSTVVVLAADFIDFSVNKSAEKSVALQWKVASSEEVSSYDIERSSDGIHFMKIRSVSGNIHNYTDENVPGGILYYRVKLVEKNGRMVYSKIMNIVLQPLNILLTMYPNPVGNELNIRLHTDVMEVFTVIITDMYGQIVQEEKVPANMLTKINLQAKASQVYMLTIRNRQNQKIISRSFVKQ